MAQKTAEGFIVRELLNGKSNATFDWLAVGVLKGREIKNLNERFITTMPAASSNTTASTSGGARPASNER